MKKILGLDLGVSSIGWAVIQTDDKNAENKSILGIGTRIIPLSTDEKDAFEKGNAQTKNKDRTEKRIARRNLFRYKLRRELLRDLLIKNNMLPDSIAFTLTSLELFGLRAKAVTEKVSLQELGRILLHINQKRGFKSSRKDKSEESNNSAYKQAIEERNSKLEGLTIGQFYFKQLKADPYFRIKKNIYYRKNYEEEFDKIIKTQATFYPDILTSKIINEIRNEIIFYQRNLKSQKHLIGGCEFENRFYLNKEGKLITQAIKVCPISNPLFQEFKIWQTINNIQIRSIVDKTPLIIENEMRKIIYDFIKFREKSSWEQILKCLGLSKDEYRTNIRKDITGDVTRIALLKAMEEIEIENISDLLNFEMISDPQVFEQQKLLRIWHILYSINDTTETKKSLIQQFDFSEAQASKIASIQLKDGFGSLSSKAIRKILPELIKGSQYSEACEQVGYNHSHSQTLEDKENSIVLPIEKLALLQKGALRNPAVERILNHMINLVKDIYSEYGAPDEIRIELARELKQNAEERNRTFKNNNTREKFHTEIISELSTYSIFESKKISYRDIEKYKLWLEFDKRSPYQPNKEISLTELYSNDYEIEHIIPKARLFDDSFANKCIAHVSDNRDKDNDTAYDFMRFKRATLFDQYCQFIQDFYKRKEKISKLKFERLMTSKEEIPQDFINRQLRETQYITKKSREILSTVCKNVWLSSGQVTDYLRHIWGYDNVIHDLHFPIYQSLGLTIKQLVKNDHQEKWIEKIVDWNKRLDHRHHAVDALVIASTSQGMIQSLNTLNQYIETESNESKNAALKKTGRRFEAPFDTKTVGDHVANILISFKPGKKVASFSKNKKGLFRNGKKHLIPRSSLHEETIYGISKQYEKTPVNKLKPVDLDRIVWQNEKEMISNHLESYNHDFKQAFSKKGMEVLQNQANNLSSVTLIKSEFTARYSLNKDFKVKDCASILDTKIRKIVEDRLRAHNDNPKEAFKDIHLFENRIWVNKSKGLFVEKVTCKTGLTELEFVSRGYVKTGNNHHIAIYQNEQGDLNEEAVTVWEAFERKKMGYPIINKLHPEFGELKVSMQQNEMFIFGMDKETLEENIKRKEYKNISPYLYRVQKIANKYYVFRRHIETMLDDSKPAEQMKKFIRISSLKSMVGLKVKVSRIGIISF